MLRLPTALQRRLTQLFPRAAEREQFIVDTLMQAVDALEYQPEDDRQNMTVGGTLHLFSDGGSRGNPGQAAIAYILEDPVRGEVLEQRGEHIGVETNNVAEYRALIEGLRAAKRYQPNRLVCHLDSELVVRQVNGEYQVKMMTLKPYFDEVQELAAELPDVVFTHIPRQDNHRADSLVNRALDAVKAAQKPAARTPSPPQQSLFRQPSADTRRDNGTQWQRSNVRGYGEY